MDAFTRHYIETALWAETDQDGNPLDDNYDIGDIEEETLDRMIQDAGEFQNRNWNDIEEYLKQAGHDFWLTRNRHGAGFWDGDWPKKAADRLTRNARRFGEFNLYVGDDGMIHGSPL